MDNSFGNEENRHLERFDQLMYGVNTAIPGQIVSFDASTQTCTVLIAIKMRTYFGRVIGDVVPPQLEGVPLMFPFAVGAGMALTLPVQPRDPCMLIFSQRCIDNWWQNGGLQPAEPDTPGIRRHDVNDAVAFLCVPPLPNVLGAWCTDGIEIRNRSRSSRVTLRDSGIEIDGPVSFLSNIDPSAGVTGSFTSSTGQVVTVQNGIITDIT
jgi:hypothetical protein